MPASAHVSTAHSTVPPSATALEQTALILEGGGLRGVYTSGVLRLFMDRGLWFPNVLGVSMGACNAANYLSRQVERNEIVNVAFVHDPRYLSMGRLLRGGDLFGMDFIFQDIPDRLVPFDYAGFLDNPARFWVVTTDCRTGRPVYHEKSAWDRAETMTLLRATCSLPVLAKPVAWTDPAGRARLLLDGGIADPVPLQHSRDQGLTRPVLVLTQPKGYRKSPTRGRLLARLRHPTLRGLHRALRDRHERYNRLMDEIDDLERTGKALVIRPDAPLQAGRVERDQTMLRRVIRQGHEDAAAQWNNLQDFLAASAASSFS
ncbi:Predicted phospholipase, patatin/cPLA2 family [Paucidesulfovibrio gracilis DSM 16080]|uniref:Predicted phospholipase, patatin/cPLA2 family n=1 Tax=Paucidesulfovibrio gracilis DSM 16080 TaxID=1121449 RepID=A0A1T4XY01_9BACT|nr:patatin family protein [Paucidesulfovibrio gracilis]SKA94449.1 Predicted phospholipase, patatin/cPLA2 family [Paucidesulfovibrio gracilis DSM 16080]